MKGKELISILFVQAWGLDLSGDSHMAQETILLAVNYLMTGQPFPSITGQA
jgi:hypothetical protein